MLWFCHFSDSSVQKAIAEHEITEKISNLWMVWQVLDIAFGENKYDFILHNNELVGLFTRKSQILIFQNSCCVCDDKSWPSSAHLTILLTFNFMGIA